jgi:acyl-CoA synthetase (AMP-forming)/AMP-acid ligase II
MTAVPPGLRGVLHLGGEGLGRGYLGSARLTAERFVPDPYGPPGARLFVTGDIASADDTGVLSYISRSDRQVRLRGRTVRLEEIEFAVTALPLVHRAVVVLHGPETARKLTCFVTANGADISTNALMRAMRERLPGYMLPNRFVILPEMPTTHSGKTDYPRLQEMCGLPL